MKQWRLYKKYRISVDCNIYFFISIELRPKDTPLRTGLDPFLDGKPDVTKLIDIDLSDDQVETILKVLRKQREIFEIARDIYDQILPTCGGNKEYLLIQLVKIIEDFIDSNKLIIRSKTYQQDLKKRLLILLNMNKIVQHVFNAIRFQQFIYDYLYICAANTKEFINYRRFEVIL